MEKLLNHLDLRRDKSCLDNCLKIYLLNVKKKEENKIKKCSEGILILLLILKKFSASFSSERTCFCLLV